MTDSLWDVSRAQRGHVTPVTCTADYKQHLCFSTRGNRQRMQALLYQKRDTRSFPLSNYIRQILRLPNSPSSIPENWGRIIYSYSTGNSDFLILFSFQTGNSADLNRNGGGFGIWGTTDRIKECLKMCWVGFHGWFHPWQPSSCHACPEILYN